MESDLSHYHRVDYRDRWRRDADGFPRLTLRRIFVLLRHMPPDSATAVAQGSEGWTLAHYLAAHQFHAAAGEPHPWEPKSRATVSPERARAVREARQRAKERREAIAAGTIT